MRKRMGLLLAAIAVVAVAAYMVFIYQPHSTIDNAEIVKAQSEVFSEEDVSKAVDFICRRFREGRGCDLLKLEYIGDENNGSSQYKYLEGRYKVDEWIIFEMTFNAGKSDPRVYKPNSIQTVKYYLGRNDHGDWFYLTDGRP